MKTKKELKEACTVINKLFKRPNFFEHLCNCSNNDINEVIQNITNIINYYLVTGDIIYTYNLKELLELSSNIEQLQDIIIHPSNSYYERRYRYLGINAGSVINDNRTLELEAIERMVGFQTQSSSFHCAQITDSIKESIELSFSSPEIVFQSILRQPKNKELPMIVGTDEKSYYQSILEIRLKNLERQELQTSTRKVKRIVSNYIGRAPILVIFPRYTSIYSLNPKDFTDKETGEYIPPSYLSFITIPTKYELLSICANNKKIRIGELLDIQTGKEYQTIPEEKEPESYLHYSRYERVCVTDQFIYSNEELTQDIDYDVDLIYGALDTNNSRQSISNNPDHNIARIKCRDDINVRYQAGKYLIRNGRHRILYLKQYYVSNYSYYKQEGKLDKLKEKVTIPMSVERTIESPTINEYLAKLKELNPKVNIFKIDINNDNPELIIIFKDTTYIIRNEQELIELYNLLSNNIINNKYLLGINTYDRDINYEELMNYLILTLKEKIYDMNFLDIIEYITKEGFYQNDKYYLINSINYYYLYFEYLELQHTIQIKRLFNRPINIVEEQEEKQKKQEVGKEIKQLIDSNPELLDLDWNDFYNILKSFPQFSQYDESFLEASANFIGYQRIKFLQYYSKEKYAKPFPI